MANRNNSLHSRQAVRLIHVWVAIVPRGNARMEADRGFPLVAGNCCDHSLRMKNSRTVQLFPFKFKSTYVRLKRSNHTHTWITDIDQCKNSLKFCRWYRGGMFVKFIVQVLLNFPQHLITHFESIKMLKITVEIYLLLTFLYLISYVEYLLKILKKNSCLTKKPI